MGLVLGIETSCDETAVALVSGSPGQAPAVVHGETVLSQMADHAAFGGVVPEIAARAHSEHLPSLITATLDKSGKTLADVDAIAATVGPGLVGGLMVGALTGKALSYGLKKPFLAINHLAGHALSPRLSTPIGFPYLLLLVSGGHCQILRVEGPDTFIRLGTTLDDAAGEAFDKVAKMMMLGYPGGPAIETCAQQGDANRFGFPRSLVDRAGFDFSFSGLKTAVRRTLDDLSTTQGLIDPVDAADVAASFQAAVSDCLCGQVAKALDHQDQQAGPTALVVAGGVAANGVIRAGLQRLALDQGLPFAAPPLRYCTDNAAMIAWAGLERLAATPDLHEPNAPIRPRWPLDQTATPLSGSGRKGAKA